MSSTAFSFEPFAERHNVVTGDAGPDPVLLAEQARQEGYAAGFAQGMEAARVEAHALLGTIGEALGGIRVLAEQTADRVEQQAVELALQIASKVLTAELAARPERVADVVRGALRLLVDRERIQVLVHPDDLETMREAMEMLRTQLGGIEHYEVQAERRMMRGGAVVRTATGEVDARLETKLERVRELFAAAAQEPEAEPEAIEGELLGEDPR